VGIAPAMRVTRRRVRPAYDWLPAQTMIVENRRRFLNAPFQTEANSDPAQSRNYEIDAEKEPKNVKARHRPMNENYQAKQKRNDARDCNPDPGHFLFHAERQNNPHYTRGDEREPEQQSQHCRGKEGIFECEKTGDDIKDTEQYPKEKFTPILDLKRADDFSDA
jgi:hypothetical protein